MHSMSERVWKRKLGIGSEEQPEFDNEFDRMKASRRRLAYSGNYDNDERRCKCLESFDQIKCDQRFGFPSYDRLIVEHDGRSQPNDDSWYPRKGNVTERERYSSQFRGSAHYCRNSLFKRGFDEHSEASQFTCYKLCRNCDSGSCRRGSEFGQLCQDVYKDSYKRLDDAYLNDLQSDSDRSESRRRRSRGHEKDWKRAIDKGRDDYQWHSSDLDSSSDMDSDTPPRKRATSTRICKWFLRGHCWRGSSCWHVHDVSGDDFHRGHSPHRPAGRQGGLLSGDDIRVTDRYLFSPLEIKHNFHTTQEIHVSTRIAGDKTEVTGPNYDIKGSLGGEPSREARSQTDVIFGSFNAEGHSKSSWKHIPVVSDEVLQRTINCEASEQTESDGWRSWGDTSRHKRLATYDSRHRSGSDNARNLNIDQMGDFDGYASDHKSLKRSERIDLKSNSYFARGRQKIGCRDVSAIDGHEFSDGNSDVDFNGCRRRIKTNGRKDRPFSGKRSEIGNFDGKTTTRNANNASRFKPKRLKKESASDHDHKHLPWKDDSATLCKYFKRGYCKRGNRCWFHHQTVTHRAPVDMDEKKSPTNETSPSTDVIPVVESTVHDTSMESHSTKNTKRSHQRKAQNSGRSVGRTPAKSTGEHSETTTSYIKAFPGKKSALETDIQDRRPAKEKKLGCNPEGKCEGGHKKSTEISIGIRIVPETDMQKDLKERRRKNYDYKEDEGDDNQKKTESANLRTQCAVKTTTAQQIVLGKMLAVDPCAIDLKSLDYEMASVNEEVTEKTSSNDHHSPDLIRVPSASLGQYIFKTGTSKATAASCNAVMESYPSLKNANQFLVEENSLKTGADLDPQPVSSDIKVGKSQKALSSGFDDRLCFERLSTEKLLAMPLERQLELQESCASMGEFDQWIGSCQDNKLVINQEGTSNTTGCIETAVGEKALLEADMNDEFVDDKVCDSQELEVDECQKTNSALGYCGVNNSCATTVSTDQCGEEMLTRETCPVISIVNTEASFEKQETEEASVDDIGLDMSLEHYIYSSLSLDRYICNMEDEIEATTCAFPEATKAVVTSENPIQHTDGSSAQQTCDIISETKPILTSSTYDSGLNSGRMTSTEIEEIPDGLDDERHERCTLNEQEKRPGVQLEPTNVGNILAAETSLRVHEELNFSREETNVIFAADSMDKYSDSSCMGRNNETKQTSSWNTSCRGSDFETNISEESGSIPSGPLSEQYDIPISEQEQDETDALRLKGPVASSNVNEKRSSAQDSCNAAGKLSCYDSNDSDSKCEESIEDNQEKAFLKTAVLVLVKEILDPLWSAGRITTKDIYKTIARKSVDKVCGSVQGVSIPRTKDSVDCYLLRNKPKIAQLVLEYVYMYPVKQ